MMEILLTINKNSNILNETLLEITALSDEEENTIGEELDKHISTNMVPINGMP
jgi:hypothetical protein